MLDHVLLPPTMPHTQDARENGGTVKKEDLSMLMRQGSVRDPPKLTKPLEGKWFGIKEGEWCSLA